MYLVETAPCILNNIVLHTIQNTKYKSIHKLMSSMYCYYTYMDYAFKYIAVVSIKFQCNRRRFSTFFSAPNKKTVEVSHRSDVESMSKVEISTLSVVYLDPFEI